MSITAGPGPDDHLRRTVAVGAGPALLALDCAGLLLLWPITMFIVAPAMPTSQEATALLLYPAIALLAFYALGLYRREAGASLRRALGRVPLAATAGALVGSGVMLFLAPEAVRLGVAAGGCVLTGAAAARVTFDVLRRRGVVCRRLLVLGAGQRAWDLVWLLRTEGRTLGYRITFLQDPALGAIDPRILDESLGEIVTMGPGGIREVADRIQPDEIVVAPDERRGMDLHGLLDCKIAGFPVSEYLGFIEREVRRVDIKRIELSWLLYWTGFT